MKKYLSSYKIGNQPERLAQLFGENKKVAYISNALDMMTDLEKRKSYEKSDIKNLENLGLKVELLDLKKYFGKKEELKIILRQYAGVFVSGGNVFVLNQAYRLSGFGKIVQDYELEREDFVYAGYSAGVCVLSPNLDGYHLVDDVYTFPYPELSEQIWEGLGIIDFNFSPHFDSDHSESELVEKEIRYCIENKILFKALRDGEVLIIK